MVIAYKPFCEHILFGIVWLTVFSEVYTLKYIQVTSSAQWSVNVKNKVKKNETNEYSMVVKSW